VNVSKATSRRLWEIVSSLVAHQVTALRPASGTKSIPSPVPTHDLVSVLGSEALDRQFLDFDFFFFHGVISLINSDMLSVRLVV